MPDDNSTNERMTNPMNITKDILKNGATILKRKSTRPNHLDIVLAKTANNGFVTWVQNMQDVAQGFDGTYHGEYFQNDLKAALRDFELRS